MSDPRQIRHVEEIFSGRGVGDGKRSHLFEKKSSFNNNTNVFKNKRAPEPPKGQNALPKIGSYQPKIYLEPKPGAPIQTENKQIVTSADVHHERNGMNNTTSNVKPLSREINKDFFIIGDKDIPMIIEEKSDVQNAQKDNDSNVFDNEPQPVAPPRRKRRAPSAPDDSEAPITTNPLYGRSVSLTSDTTRLDSDFDTHGGDIDFSYGIDNPGYQKKGYSSSRTEHAPVASVQQSGFHKSDDELPYIPPPDYDDEELTMDFDEEQEEHTIDIRQNRTSSLYKDFEGEDFGKYLEDDIDYRPDPSRHQRGSQNMDGRDQKFLPRAPQKDKRFNNKNKKKSKKESDLKRNTIRDFTFTDSKIGWGDRTVKSTSAKGRYIKREKDRRRIGKAEDVDDSSTSNTPGSYEEFLRMKNGLNHKDTSPNSSDSGVEIGDDSQLMDMYLHSQPKQYKMAPKYDNRKPSVWKKLTLRFKKSVTVTNSGNR